MSDGTSARVDSGVDHEIANIVNDKMIALDVGGRPAIARDDKLLDHAVDAAERVVTNKSLDNRIDMDSIDNAILLAEANQTELLADYGVIRRQAFRRQLESHMKRIALDPALQKGGVVLLMSDGNGTKIINDNVSHLLGDQFIKMWADQLTKHLRQGQGDIFFQYGTGDELAGMLPVDSLQDAQKMMDGDNRSGNKTIGRVVRIKDDIIGERNLMAKQYDLFPKDDQKEYGTLAIGWDWMSNLDLLQIYNESGGNMDNMVGMMYSKAEQKMKQDKGNNSR